jgi:hypothetical protein
MDNPRDRIAENNTHHDHPSSRHHLIGNPFALVRIGDWHSANLNRAKRRARWDLRKRQVRASGLAASDFVPAEGSGTIRKRCAAGIKPVSGLLERDG